MNKKIICALLAVLFLAACSGNKNNETHTTDTTPAVTAGVSDTSEPDKTEEGSTVDKGNKEPAVTVTIPPIPESGVSEIPDEHVLYSDTDVVVVVDPDGTSYANGKPVSPDDAANIIVQQMSPNKTTATSTEATAGKSTTTAAPDVTETEITAPDVTAPETTTRPQGTIIVDDKNNTDIFNLAKYVSTGETDLKITDIKVYNGSKPGLEGVDAFKPGDTVIVNLWCNAMARFDSVLYVVPEEAEHKDSYADEDCLMKYEIYSSSALKDDQIAFEFDLPEKVPAGVYEFRFICGTEEGYIPFHIG